MHRLLTLRRQLEGVHCLLVLLVSEPHFREVISAAGLDRYFAVVADEAELAALVRGAALGGPEPGKFTAAELAELDAGGATLEDAILSIEKLPE